MWYYQNWEFLFAECKRLVCVLRIKSPSPTSLVVWGFINCPPHILNKWLGWCTWWWLNTGSNSRWASAVVSLAHGRAGCNWRWRVWDPAWSIEHLHEDENCCYKNNYTNENCTPCDTAHPCCFLHDASFPMRLKVDINFSLLTCEKPFRSRQLTVIIPFYSLA